MFDPLMTIAEISENCEFLLDDNLGGACSAPLNEMRVQPQSSYLALLHRAEARTGRVLYERSVDSATLTHTCTYADNGVATLVGEVRAFMQRAEQIAYPIKTAVRYGDGGTLADVASEVRRALEEYRTGLVMALGRRVAHGQESFSLGASAALDELTSSIAGLGVHVQDGGAHFLPGLP